MSSVGLPLQIRVSRDHRDTETFPTDRCVLPTKAAMCKLLLRPISYLGYWLGTTTLSADNRMVLRIGTIELAVHEKQPNERGSASCSGPDNWSDDPYDVPRASDTRHPIHARMKAPTIEDKQLFFCLAPGVLLTAD